MSLAEATVCRYRGGRILQADLRETRSVSRRLAMTPPQTCWTFGGWCVWPFTASGAQSTHRIRKMCTHALIYPCAWWDEDGWHNDGTEHSARLDTLKPTMGHETSIPSGGGSYFPRPPVETRTESDGPGLPAEWPWVDVCNGCWNFSSFQWFAGTSSDWDFAARSFQLLELMQSTDSARRLRKHGPPTSPTWYYAAPAMDWPCFADQVALGALVSLALTIEVFKAQNKTTKAYGAVVNIYVTGKISVRVPLIGSP